MNYLLTLAQIATMNRRRPATVSFQIGRSKTHELRNINNALLNGTETERVTLTSELLLILKRGVLDEMKSVFGVKEEKIPVSACIYKNSSYLGIEATISFVVLSGEPLSHIPGNLEGVDTLYVVTGRDEIVAPYVDTFRAITGFQGGFSIPKSSMGISARNDPRSDESDSC